MAIVIFVNIFVIKYCNIEIGNIKITYKISSDNSDNFQAFYSMGGEWLGENGQDYNYDSPGKEALINFVIPFEAEAFRIDLGNNKNEVVEIKDVKMSFMWKKYDIDIDKLYDGKNQESFGKTYRTDEGYKFEINSDDPFMVYNISEDERGEFINTFEISNILIKAVICIIFDLAAVLCYIYRNIVRRLFGELINNRKLIINLSLNDFKVKYAGSYLGITWAFVQPIVTILVYWFVFQYGLRSSSPEEGVPFVLWFMTGLVPWFFFSEAINNGTNSFVEYSYLVKKVKFKISILPIVKIISSFYVHVVFVAFLFILYIIGKVQLSLYMIQIVYYCFCMTALTMAIVYSTSALVVFFKDLSQVINIFLQVGMWMTPILWSYTILSDKMLFLMKLNPMFYIVEGYRDSFIGRAWFFEKYFQTMYFWCFTLFLFILGMYLFKKLKPHFSDVL